MRMRKMMSLMWMRMWTAAEQILRMINMVRVIVESQDCVGFR